MGVVVTGLKEVLISLGGSGSLFNVFVEKENFIFLESIKNFDLDFCFKIPNQFNYKFVVNFLKIQLKILKIIKISKI